MRNRFFIQLFLVICISVLASSWYYRSICQSLRNTQEGPPGKLNKIFYDTTHYDAFFAGTSRVLRNINAVRFDSITGIQSYNAGIDGANFTLINLMTRQFIEHHHPKYVFINLDTYSLETDSNIFYYPQLYPHDNIRGMEPLFAIEPHLLIGKSYPFIAVSYLDDYLKGVAFRNNLNMPYEDTVASALKGYMPIDDDAYHGTTDALPLHFTYTDKNFERLDSLCSYCTAIQCRVFFIMAPIYNANPDSGFNTRQYYQKLKKIETKYNIKILKHFTDTRFNQSMFYNNTHLNRSGAELYTTILANEFKFINLAQ